MRHVQLKLISNWLIFTSTRMQWPCSFQSSNSSLSCITFLNCLLALVERSYNSMTSHSKFKSAYTMFCNYLLPSNGSASRCIWAGSATAHTAADFIVLCKLILPTRTFSLFHRFNLVCVKLQSIQRGHLIRKKWKLGPSSYSSHPQRSSHATQQLASQAISAAALDVGALRVPPAPSVTVSVQRFFKAKLSPLALELLDTHTISYMNLNAAAAIAGVLPAHPAGLLRFPVAADSVGDHVAVDRQKALIELRRLMNRISRFLRGCVQRQSCVAVAAAMSLSRRQVASHQSAKLKSLELYPLQFPAGISRILVMSFSSGFKLHSSVRALLSHMRSNLAGVSLLLKRLPMRSSQLVSSNDRNPNVIAICASGLLHSRLPSRSVASFVRLQFCQDMPQGCSRLHLAPLAYNPGVTRNQQIAALCYGQPLQGGWRNGQTHRQWLDKHWSGLAVAGTLHAMQDSQLFQLMVTVDRVLMGGEAKAKSATNSTIAAAVAAEGDAPKISSMQRSSNSILRDAATEFLTVCARVGGRRTLLHATLPSRDASSESTPAIYVQSMLLLFNDLSNNFLLQLTQRQQHLLVTTAFLTAFQILAAALHIQRCTRGHAARRIMRAAVRRVKHKQHERHRNDAARKISQSFRLHSARLMLRGVFAMRLQRVWRGHMTRQGLISARIAFKVQIQVDAAKLLQWNWKGHMAQRFFNAACSIVKCRSFLFNQEKDAALVACVRKPSRVWSDTSLQHEADFISRSSPCVWFPILLSNQKQWVAAGLLRQRTLLVNAESEAFVSFMAKASSEAEGICLAQLNRAWKGHFCKKHVGAMLKAAKGIRLLARSNRASRMLQQAWRARCARLAVCAMTKACQIARRQHSSNIIVHCVLCYRSRCHMRYLRRHAGACVLQRSFRAHTAASLMSTAVELAIQEFSILRREVAAARLQSVYRGRRCRLECVHAAARMVAQMLSWNGIELLRYDSRHRLAVVIARHRPYLHSNNDLHGSILPEPCFASPTDAASILRRVAFLCCSCVGSSIVEWGFKRIRKEKIRCQKLAQIYAHQTIAALLLQSSYRAHIHRRKHFKPFLPKHRATVLRRRRVAAATCIQCLWRSAVARLALACISALAMRGRWMTRTRWARNRAKDTLLSPLPPTIEPAGCDRLPSAKIQELNFFDVKLNGWCTMAHSLMLSVLLPADTATINAATSASFQLCERIEGFVGAYPSSDRFFGGDAKVASLLQQIERLCPQHTARCWDTVSNCVPKDAVTFAADPTLSPAHAILSYFRQFVSAMLAHKKSARERDAMLLNLRASSQGAGARAAFIVHFPAVAASSLRLMLIHSSAAVLASLHWLFTRWGNTELMGGRHTSSSFMFPISHNAEFVHECHGVWSMLLQCHVRPILFCLDMLVGSMSKPLFELLHGAGAALVCNAISALLMLMSFWLQTSLHPQHAHCESCLWILFSACTLESKYVSTYLEESLRNNAPSIRLNVMKLLHASVLEHEACVSAALGRQSDSIASLMRVENLLHQLSLSSISGRPESDHFHGPPSPAEQICWREVATASALLFDCFGGNSGPARAAASE